ncbi:MAG: FAD-dependent oxidoreductase [Armatimonadota bacterium]
MEHRDVSCDVLVVGAGAAGLPAAIGAARAGARVLLIEEDPVVGGAPSDYYVCLFYGAPITGVLDELHTILKAKYSPVPGAQFFLPVAFQRAWGELLASEPNLTVMTGAKARDVRAAERGGRPTVTGVSVEVTPGQHFDIASKVTIDCSGSGEVSVAAGCAALYGRDARSDFGEPSAPEKADDWVQAVTWMYFVQRMPDSKPLPKGFRPGVGVLTGIRPRGHLGPWPSEEAMRAPDPGLYLQWGCAVPCRDTRDPIALAESHKLAYEQMADHHAVLQEHGYQVYLAPRIGVREANRIVGEWVMREQDLRDGVFPEDTIAIADYGLDIWQPRAKGQRGSTVEEFGMETARYGIPYRALVPRDVDGLLVAGKCMSGTHIAQSSFRVQPIVASAGQAAGVAAALAAKHNTQPRRVDPREVQAILRRPDQHVQLSFD